MNLQFLIDSLVTDTLETSLPRYGPELILCASMVGMLLMRIVRLSEKIPPFLMALTGAVVALWSALPNDGMNTWAQMEPCELFTGMLVYDSLYLYTRIFLLAFLVLFVILSRLTGIADKREGQDYYTLVFGATLGMCIMASANHLIIVFLGIEMASVPSYVLAGIVQGRRRSSEAALKYAIYGAGTAGVMLYGISLLSGILGSAYLPTMAQRLAAMDLGAMMQTESVTEGMGAAGEGKGDSAESSVSGSSVSGHSETSAQNEAQADESLQVHSPLVLMVLALGGLMLGVGLAFKLSAVPFHFWCPDVFEGASAEVGAFLSVASKAAAMVLLLRIGLGLGTYHEPASSLTTSKQSALESGQAELFELSRGRVSVKEVSLSAATQKDSFDNASPKDPLMPVRHFIVLLVGMIAAVTCTFGNLAAYGQRNIKRMLAYSTIAHAGYMMMAVAATISLVGRDPLQMRVAVQSLLLYASIYFFMNLGAFSFVAFMRNAMGSEEIKDYAGLIRNCPLMSVAMVLILFSLVGLPPMAGFIGKFRIFQALFEAGGPLMMFLLVVAGINTAISLVYYLRVAKTICIDPEPDTRGPVSLGFLPVSYTLLVSFPVLLFGILPSWLVDWAYLATAQLFT
ncbi:MAG: NADH-quinone oxidoreductase subunit N [Pirellulales bacterium]